MTTETTAERNDRLMGCYRDVTRFGYSTYKQNLAVCKAGSIEAEDIISHLTEVVLKKRSLNKEHKNLWKILKLEGMQYLMQMRNQSSAALYQVDPSADHWAYTQEEVEDFLEAYHTWDDLPKTILDALYHRDMPQQYRESLMIRYSYGVITSSRHCNQCNAEQTRNVAARNRLMEILNIKLATGYGYQNSAPDDRPRDLRDDVYCYSFDVKIRQTDK